MIDFVFVHSQEHHYITPATPDRFDASVNQYDAYGRPKARRVNGWWVMFEWEVSQTLPKNQHSELNGSCRNQRIMGLLIFFFQPPELRDHLWKKRCESESWWRLQLRIGTHFGANDIMTFLYNPIDLNPQWSHIRMFYVWNIEIFPLSIVDRWCSMDIFMVTCLKSATQRRHLGVKSQQVSSVWFIGRRLQVWSIEKVWSWQSFAASSRNVPRSLPNNLQHWQKNVNLSTK